MGRTLTGKRSNRVEDIGLLVGKLSLFQLSVFVVLTCAIGCGGTFTKGGMEADLTVYPGAVDVTNLNDFPWYGLIITINEKYSNELLLDKGNWPYFSHDSVLKPGDVRKGVGFEGNFVYSEDDYLDPTDVWWEGIPYSITVERIELRAKSELNGPYDLRVTYSIGK